MTATPSALHEALVRVSGDVDALSDLELSEIGVTREHATDYAAILRELTPGTVNPFSMSGDDTSSHVFWRERYDQRVARGDTSY